MPRYTYRLIPLALPRNLTNDDLNTHLGPGERLVGLHWIGAAVQPLPADQGPPTEWNHWFLAIETPTSVPEPDDVDWVTFASHPLPSPVAIRNAIAARKAEIAQLKEFLRVSELRALRSQSADKEKPDG